MNWKGEKSSFYDDKYIPIHPSQGTFLYMQARALNAKSIFEFGTSYGISTIYLGKAAKDNGGRVISTENVPQKVHAARQHIREAGLRDYVQIIEGDVSAMLKTNTTTFDMVLLDGFPDLVFDVFKLLEPHLKIGALIIVDDVEGFQGAMQDYLNYIRNPKSSYLSVTLRPSKGLEFTLKVK